MQHLVKEQSLDCLAVPLVEATRTNKTGALLEKRSNGSERRLHGRESLQIDLRPEKGKGAVPSHTMDISVAGLSLICEIDLLPGTPLALRFCIGGTAYLHLVGQVVFCRPNGSGTATGYVSGIKFAALREWDRALLVSAISELTTHGDTLGKSFLSLHISEDSLGVEAAGIAVHTSRTFEDWSIRPRRSCVHASKITGWGSYLPDTEITTNEINELLGKKGYKKIGNLVETLTGIKTRRFASSNEKPSDLAVQAGLKAIANAGVDPKDIEVIIFCGISHDVEEPATACIVQEKLGAENAYVFDLTNACNGFVSGIDVLDSFIASGRCETGLVVVGELISQYIDWEPESKDDLKQSFMGYTLGDGGGAAVLSRIKEGDRRGIVGRWFSTHSSHWDLAVVPLYKSNERHFKSNGYEIQKCAIKYVPVGVEQVMKQLHWTIDDIDVIIPHQVSAPIIENLFVKTMGIPMEKLSWTFSRHGNVGAASIPVGLCEAIKEGRVKEGDRALLVSGSGGFGVGVIGLVV